MYTVTIINKTVDRISQMLVLDVEFSDGQTTFSRKLNVALSDPLEDVKKKIKGYITQLETGEANADTIPVGPLDLSSTVIGQPQADIDFANWYRKFTQLKQVQELIDLGIVANDNPKVTALRSWLSTNLNTAYIDKL